MKKAFLLINGNPPKDLPNMQHYEKVFCTDGAYRHLLSKNIYPHTVIGDFDSITAEDISSNVEVVKKINQDFTDFYKCLEVICEEGFECIDVYGSTGLEHDHFLGNLTTALQFKDKIELIFYDDYSKFYFTKKQTKLSHINHRIISLYPYPIAKNVNSKGLFYPLNGMDLDIAHTIGTRNHSIKDEVEITYDEGELLLFISEYTVSEKELNYKNQMNN